MPRIFSPTDRSQKQPNDLPENMDDEFLRQELRRKLLEKYRNQMPIIDEFVPDEETGRRQRNYAFSDALMDSASQIGTLRGKQADTDMNYKLSKSLTESEDRIGDAYLKNQEATSKRGDEYLQTLDYYNDSDPNSPQSQMYREITKQMYPGLAEKLGDGFNSMSKADFEKSLPLVSKMIGRNTGKTGGMKLTDYMVGDTPMVYDPDTGTLRPATVSDTNGQIVNPRVQAEKNRTESYEKMVNWKKDEAKRKAEADALDRGLKREDLLQRRSERQEIAKRKAEEAAFKQTPQGKIAGMSSTDKARYDYIKEALQAVTQAENALNKIGWDRTAKLKDKMTIGATEYSDALERWNQAYGRMLSGGAIGVEEAKDFKNALPGVTDSDVESKSKIARTKQMLIDRLKTLGFSPEDAGFKNIAPTPFQGIMRKRDKNGVLREKNPQDGKWYPVGE